MFLIICSEDLRKEMFGERLWKQLQEERCIITNGYKGMSLYIIRGNIKRDKGFCRLVENLKDENA